MELPSQQPQQPQKTVREIRINPVVPTQSVLVATARSMRPKKEEAPVAHDSRPHVETCPFCKGNESKTPPPIAQVPAEGDWQLRIVENLYPVLGDDRENPQFAFGLQQTIDGYGRHEVVIDHSSHGIRINEMTGEHLALLLATYRHRMEELYRSDPALAVCIRVQELRPRRRSEHHAYPQPDHRHAHRARQRTGGGQEQRGVLRVPASLHFLQPHR